MGEMCRGSKRENCGWQGGLLGSLVGWLVGRIERSGQERKFSFFQGGTGLRGQRGWMSAVTAWCGVVWCGVGGSLYAALHPRTCEEVGQEKMYLCTLQDSKTIARYAREDGL